MKLLKLFNLQTFSVLLVSQIAAFLVIRYQIKFNINIVLFGLAIAFPLSFSLQAAFKRRDKALEYFSMFKASVIALHYSFRISKDLEQEQKTEVQNLLTTMSEGLVDQLEQKVVSYKTMQSGLDKIFAFVQKNKENISGRNVMRIIRYLRDAADSSVYLVSLVRHRTMAGIRFYTFIFILLFPLVHAPILYYRFDGVVPDWGFYLGSAFTSLVLVTLANFQRMIEYPFDPDGMDNIQVRDFLSDVRG